MIFSSAHPARDKRAIRSRLGTFSVRYRMLAVAVVVLAAASSARAQFFTTFTWTNPSGGSYNSSSNWDFPGIPNDSDEGSRFNSGGAYIVDFPTDISTAAASVRSGLVTFNLDSSGTRRTYTLNSLTVNPTTPGAQPVLAIHDGQVNANSITVAGGGRLIQTNSGISAADGSVTISGEDSFWENDEGFLRVGETGVGTLRIEDSGRLFNLDGAAIGRFAGSDGTATVTGNGSEFDVAANLTIGQEGIGTLNVEAGGSVVSGLSYLGFDSDSTGTVTVTGPDSAWTHSDDLNIGFRGSGSLTISDGGRVTSADLNNHLTPTIIAAEENSVGTVTVTGANSAWSTGPSAVIGSEGQATLTIADGGAVTFGSSSTVGFGLTGDGTIMVTGGNSHLEAGSFFDLGHRGKGKLQILDGATATINRVTMAFRRFGEGAVEVIGPGSSLIVPNDSVHVGYRGKGELDIFNSGSVTSRNGSIGTLDNAEGVGDGRVAIFSGGSWTISNRLTIGGDANGANGGSGELFLGQSGLLHVGDEIVFYPDGVLELAGDLFANSIRFDGGGEFDWGFGALHVGQYHGDLVNTRGTLAPGDPTGNTLILGDYTQQAGGTLQIELGGPGMGTTFDFVNITGTAIIDGQLELALANDFIPQPDAEFIVFNADNLFGIFDNAANNQRLDVTDGGGSFLVHYGVGSPFEPTQIVLSDFMVEPLPGDYNDDGIVDAADYTVWRDALGSATSLLNDDTPGVGQDDYTRWKTNFEQSASAAAMLANSTAVPEPATGWLLASGLLLTAGSRLRQ